MSPSDKRELVVCMGYGPEHPVFLRTRDLWSVFRNFFSEIDLVFYKSSHDLRPDEYSFSNGEYVFGMPADLPKAPLLGMAPHDAQGFVIDRQLKLYRRLLSTYQRPFWLFATSVTAAIDLRALRTLTDNLVCSGVYAGSILHATLPEGLGPDMPAGGLLRMVSGSGTLLSSDVLELVLARAYLVQQHMLNDVWLSIVLRDIPRVPLLRYDITDVTEFTAGSRSILHARIKQAVGEGHFHFRVKSGRWEMKDQLGHNPEQIDPLVINDVLLEILSSPLNPNTVLRGWSHFKQQVCDIDGQAMKPIV